MRFGLSLTAALGASLSLAFAAPAVQAQSLGTWQDYIPAGQKYYFQNPGNGSVYGPVGVKALPGVGREDHYHAAAGDTCSGAGTFIEMIEVKYCSMTNMATGVVTGDQFRVFLGNKSLAGAEYPITVATHDGKPATRFYYDNNANFVPDAGDTGYYVSCPGAGHPYATHEIKATQNIIQTWFHQGSSRFFWDAVVTPPETKSNPNWGSSGGTAQAIMHSDAFWCANPYNDSCPVNGVWQVGAGSNVLMSDGLYWPDPSNVGIGRKVWHAKYIGPVWWQDTWWPYTHSSGLDRAEPFSGC
ncbi:MAG: hypothetical protein Q8Q88_19705 [Phenylobacterium sp.]|uniref:hypothetical protein n=1 Tax=Phenylobacterium sp. TaxID=1871053 RepID=UPI0027354219|nr:hypothetical protein [Phenylobacterium sp.]MDP3749268.1 hypothetical protein [Phenylobacterium sp.]